MKLPYGNLYSDVLYYHYKDKENKHPYRVIGFAKSTDDESILVLYQRVKTGFDLVTDLTEAEEFPIWARNLKEFTGTVSVILGKKKHKVPRFKPAGVQMWTLETDSK